MKFRLGVYCYCLLSTNIAIWMFGIIMLFTSHHTSASRTTVHLTGRRFMPRLSAFNCWYCENEITKKPFVYFHFFCFSHFNCAVRSVSGNSHFTPNHIVLRLWIIIAGNVHTSHLTLIPNGRRKKTFSTTCASSWWNTVVLCILLGLHRCWCVAHSRHSS